LAISTVLLMRPIRVGSPSIVTADVGGGRKLAPFRCVRHLLAFCAKKGRNMDEHLMLALAYAAFVVGILVVAMDAANNS
jgi:hypothetical protein